VAITAHSSYSPESMVFPNSAKLEVYSEHRISSTHIKYTAVEEANKDENRQKAFNRMSLELDCDSVDVAPKIKLGKSRNGLPTLRIGSATITVDNYLNKQSLIEQQREEIRQNLYEQELKRGKELPTNAGLVTLDIPVEEVPERHRWVILAYVFELLKLQKHDPKKHNYCVLSALLTPNQKVRILTRRLDGGVSTTTSLASTTPSLRRGPDRNDNNEGPSSAYPGRDRGSHNYAGITASGNTRGVFGNVYGNVIMPTENRYDTHFARDNKGFQAAHIGGDVSGTNFNNEAPASLSAPGPAYPQAYLPPASDAYDVSGLENALPSTQEATRTRNIAKVTNVQDALADVQRTRMEFNNAEALYIYLQKNRGTSSKRIEEARVRCNRKKDDYEKAKLIMVEAERASTGFPTSAYSSYRATSPTSNVMYPTVTSASELPRLEGIYDEEESQAAPVLADSTPYYSSPQPPQQTYQQGGMDDLGTRMGQTTIEDDNRSAAPSSSRHSGKNHHSNRNRRSHRAVITQVFSGKNGLYFNDNGESKYLNQLTPEKRASLGRLYFATDRGTDSGADEIQYVDELTDKQRASLEMNQDTTPRFSDGDAREIDLAQYGLAYSATPSMSQSSSHSQASKTPDNSEWKGKSRQAADSALNEKISDRVENQLSKFDFYYGYYGYYDNARRYEKYAELCEELNAEECELFQKKVKKKYGDW
jgi:hypothetical protein